MSSKYVFVPSTYKAPPLSLAKLFEILLLVKFVLSPEIYIAPPELSVSLTSLGTAVLFMIVLLKNFASLPSMDIAPPTGAVLYANKLSSTRVRSPTTYIEPPSESAVLFFEVILLNTALSPIIWNPAPKPECSGSPLHTAVL